MLNVPLLWITSVDSLLFIQQCWNSWLFAELWDELRTAINTGLLCFNSGSCRYELWQLYFSLVVQIFDMDRANLWCRRINWNKNWGRRRSFPLNTEKQRDRGWAVYVAQVSWLLLINPPAPRICPIWAPNGAAAPIFCPLFSGHFRPIFEPRCPRVPCYPPWWTDRPILVPLWPLQNWVRTGLRSQEWDYALILVSVIFQPQIICSKISSRKSALKSASLAALANPLHQARRNRSPIHQTRFPFVLVVVFKCIVINSSYYQLLSST